MSYAIAMTEKKLSHHFSKTEVFHFYDEHLREVAAYKNPALNQLGCAGKKRIVELFQERQCHTVIVRKIGEKTLARLLNAGFKVVQGNTRHSIEEMLSEARLNKNLLTDASQGIKKSSCGCNHS